MSSPLLQVALGVTDLDRAAQFYGVTLGLPEIARFDPPGLAFFDVGGVRLLLERTTDPTPGSSVLYLSTTGIDRRAADLADAGVVFTSDPHLIHVDAEGTFGGAGVEEWMAFFVDPDGNPLALVERRTPAGA
ncbi:MAG: VOC family protein [bacterium]|nr:VOC family protein [bacterium]